MKKIILFFLLACSFSTFAQTPGYLGERFSFQGDLSLFYRFFGPKYYSNYNSFVNYSLGINTRWNLYLDYVLTCNSTVGITGKYIRTGNVTDELFNIQDPISVYDNGYYSQTQNFIYYFDDITAIGVGAYYRRYLFRKKGSIAPVGAYHQFEITEFFCSNEAVPENPVGGTSTVAPVNLGVTKALAFTYTIGIQNVFFDRLIVSGGFQIGFVPHALWGGNENQETTDYQGYNNSVLIENTASRLQGTMLLNANIGLGLILF